LPGELLPATGFVYGRGESPHDDRQAKYLESVSTRLDDPEPRKQVIELRLEGCQSPLHRVHPVTEFNDDEFDASHACFEFTFRRLGNLGCGGMRAGQRNATARRSHEAADFDTLPHFCTATK
jgi:hypothetical protein